MYKPKLHYAYDHAFRAAAQRRIDVTQNDGILLAEWECVVTSYAPFGQYTRSIAQAGIDLIHGINRVDMAVEESAVNDGDDDGVDYKDVPHHI